MTTSHVEIDEHTRAGHARFKKTTRFSVNVGGSEVTMSWDEWMDWQKNRDPLSEDPRAAKAAAALVAKQMAAEREAARGPGMSKRPRPAKKTAAARQKAQPPSKES